jgi:hypothetical protein
MFGIGPVELLVILLIGGFFCAVIGIVVAAAIRVLKSPKTPHDPRS